MESDSSSFSIYGIFSDPSDYDKIREDDRLSIFGTKNLAPGKTLTLKIHHADGKEERAELTHSFTDEQIPWFKAGSALNLMKGR